MPDEGEGSFIRYLPDGKVSVCLLIKGSWVRVPARSPLKTLIRQEFQQVRLASVLRRDFSRVTPRVTTDTCRFDAGPPHFPSQQADKEINPPVEPQ